jgi:hypothetical protein
MPEPTATRVSRRSLPALSTLAAVFVLPTYRDCTGEPLHTPAYYAADPKFFWAVAPVFFIAVLLAALTVRALARNEVDRRGRKMALAGLGVLAVTMALPVVMLETSVGWALTAAAAITAAVALVRRGRGRPAWEIWERLLGAFGLVALATFPSYVLIGDLVEGSTDSFGPGAWVYLASLGGLLVLTLLPRLQRRGPLRPVWLGSEGMKHAAFVAPTAHPAVLGEPLELE